MGRTWIGGVVAALLCLTASGCGIGEADSGEDPVPTLSVRPSAAPSTESGFTVSAEPSPSGSTSPSDASTTPSSPSGSPTEEPEPSSAPEEVDLGTAPTSYDEAAAYVDEARSGGGAQQMRAFRTPEDIYCVMTSDYLDPACELPQGAGVEDRQACDRAMGDRVGRIEVTDKRVRAVCNTDTIRETVPQTVDPVGVVTHAGSGLTCAVADIGVTCVQSQREVGFFLGLDSYATFG